MQAFVAIFHLPADNNRSDYCGSRLQRSAAGNVNWRNCEDGGFSERAVFLNSNCGFFDALEAVWSFAQTWACP
jgi:hypothetical protein